MEGMSFLVKTVTRWLKGFLLVYACVLILYGHMTHGDGFSGAIIIACVFIVIFLVEGKNVGAKTLGKRSAAVVGSMGALALVGIGLAGIFKSNAFLKNFLPGDACGLYTLTCGGMIPVMNLCIGVTVGMFLFVYFFVIADFDVQPGPGKKLDEEKDLQ